MAKAKGVGLYLGSNCVGAAVAQGKEIISLASFELSVLEEGKTEVLNEDIRWEALINKALREVGADTKNAYISLADKDFIFRPLQIPLMRKSELESSLLYEIEKYLPFKITELEWDYDFTRLIKEKKVDLSFVGIKESNIRRIEDILSRLAMNPMVIEPSCLSLVRIVKSVKSFAGFKNFALLDFTKAESYLTFFKNDLPVFNRYLTIPKKEEALDLDKFIEAVNLSFQYFNSEFKAYNLEKLLIVEEGRDKSLVSALSSSLQVDTQAVLLSDLSGRSDASIASIKAFGAVARNAYPYKFNPVLRKTAALPEEAEISAPAVTTPVRMGLLGILLGIGVIACLAFSIITHNEISTKKYALKKQEENLFIPKDFTGLSWEKREEMFKSQQKQNEALAKLKASFKGLSDFLELTGCDNTLIPSGVWLKSLDISSQRGKYTGSLSGYIFRDDDYQERQDLDKLISNLNQRDEVKPLFSKVEIDFSRQEKIKDFEVTAFAVKLE